MSAGGRFGAAVLIVAMVALGWIMGGRFGLIVTAAVAAFILFVLVAFEAWARLRSLHVTVESRPGYLIPPADDFPRGAP